MEIRDVYLRLCGKRDAVREALVVAKEKERSLADRLDVGQKAQFILQKVAQQTQEEIQYRISSLVSTALESVFPFPYVFDVQFEMKRGRTEAVLSFQRDGRTYDPLDSTGGGPVDIAAFALRLVLWSLGSPRNRPTIWLDEPFRFLNDPERRLHRKAADMLKMVSEKLGLQLVVVTQIPEFIDVADKTFLVEKTGDVSRVTGERKQSHRRKKGRKK
jgi:DNA repair exonuclease SbcCD ATPase subunit